MAYQARSHQPMVVEPEEATKRPSGVDKVTGDRHRHRCQSPYLVAKPLSDPFPIFVLSHYDPPPLFSGRRRCEGPIVNNDSKD